MRMGVAQARALVEARLGRSAQDALESAMVLEAWGGLQGRSAFELGAGAVDCSPPAPVAPRPTDTVIWPEGHVVRTGVGLVLTALGIAVWIAVLTARFGPAVVEPAWRTALPLALALQGLLTRRYLGAPDGLGRLRRSFLPVVALLVLTSAAVAVFARSGALSAALVLTWTGGVVFCKRGWGPAYALTLGAGGLALQAGGPEVPVTVAVTLAAVAGMALAVFTVPASSQRTARWAHAVPAAVVGGGMGLLMVLEASWRGAYGLQPLLAVVPTLVGSLWAAYHLMRLWTTVPAALVSTSVRDGSHRPARAVAGLVAGAFTRSVLCSAVMSAALLGLAHAGGRPVGTLAELLLAFLGIGAVGFCALLLDSFGRSAAAATAVAAAVATSVLLQHHALLGGSGPGRTLLLVGVAVLVAAGPMTRVFQGADFLLARAGL